MSVGTAPALGCAYVDFGCSLYGTRLLHGDCAFYIAHWRSWLIRAFSGATVSGDTEYDTRVSVPAAAMLEVPDNNYSYQDRIGSKGRNMVRKTERLGYTFHQFRFNQHRDAIFQINTSKDVRSGGPMRAAYREYPNPIPENPMACTQHQKVWIGGFDSEGVLKAYCALALVNELAVIDSILGHADALPDGVMNGLVAHIVRYCRDLGFVRWINYLSMNTYTGLAAHKRSVGFLERPLVVRA